VRAGKKAKKLSSALLPNPSHVRLSASHVAEDSGIYHSGFGAVLMGDEYLRFVTVVEAALTVVVDGGACGGVGGGIAAREAGDSGSEADGVAVVRAAIGSQCIVLRAGR